jgi:hypothetical protein
VLAHGRGTAEEKDGEPGGPRAGAGVAGNPEEQYDSKQHRSAGVDDLEVPRIGHAEDNRVQERHATK